MHKISGLVLKPNEFIDSTKSILQVKYVYLTIHPGTESFGKITKMINKYKSAGQRLPIRRRSDGGIQVKIRFGSLIGKLGDKLSDVPRDQWMGKEYVVQFKMTHYKFRDATTGEQCNGYNFMLEHIELV